MPIDKKTFLKTVSIIVDTGEQENRHITDKLKVFKIPYLERKLDFGDYSFITQEKTNYGIKERDFSLNCVIERKRNPDEFYGNIIHDRERIESEFAEASKLCNDFVLLIENCRDMQELKAAQLTDYEMERMRIRQEKDIGIKCYETIMSWRCGNRYRFTTEFCKSKKDSANKILELFYYYWRNYKHLSANRKKK